MVCKFSLNDLRQAMAATADVCGSSAFDDGFAREVGFATDADSA
jgi:hypothetical protein